MAGFTSGTLPGQTCAGDFDAFVAKIMKDFDGDGVPDASDNCPTVANRFGCQPT